MLERTTTPINLLDMLTELELLDCSFLHDGEWIKITDRKILYHAAITCLLEAAESEGLIVTREDEYPGEPIRAIHVDYAPPESEDDYERDECESCDGAGTNEDGSTCADCQGFGSIIECYQLGAGCTCDCCTKQITDAIGM